MKNNGYYIIAVAFLVLPILASCRKELCYNHFAAADISLSYEKEWERDYGMAFPEHWDPAIYGFEYNELRPVTPQWVTLVRYSADGMSSEKYLSSAGGEVMLNGETDQSFLFYNNDTEYIVLSDMASFSQARASATSRSRSSISYIMERHPGVRSTNPPDILYSAFIEKVPDVKVHELKHMPIKMQPLVYTYVIRYEFEYGLEHVALARGALGGMAESVYLRDGRTSDETTILLYDCTLKPYGCEALVRSFGVPGFPDEYYGRSGDKTQDRPYTLNLEVILENGKTVEFNYDITDQMAKQPRGGVIQVSGIRIEDEQAFYSSGFEVDVTGWGSRIDIDLPVSAE